MTLLSNLLFTLKSQQKSGAIFGFRLFFCRLYLESMGMFLYLTERRFGFIFISSAICKNPKTEGAQVRSQRQNDSIIVIARHEVPGAISPGEFFASAFVDCLPFCSRISCFSVCYRRPLNEASRVWRTMTPQKNWTVVLVGLMLGIPFADGRGQEVQEGPEVQLPINIRVQTVTVRTGSSYRFYLPNGEFHGRVQKAFKYVTMYADTDYNFLTGDIGFGIGHVFPKAPLKPGIFFRDDLIFRPLDAETGEWNRKQGVVVRVEKGLVWHLSLRTSFKNERQKSPSKERLMDIVSFLDRTIRIGMRGSYRDAWHGHIALEKGLSFLGGDFIYTLLSVGLRGTYKTEWEFKHTFDARMEGNITDVPSPRYYLGGRSTLIGYDNDEIWGHKRALFRNDFELRMFKRKMGGRRVMCSRLSVLGRMDAGNAGHAADLECLERYKAGLGLGLGMDLIVYGEGPIWISVMVGSRLSGERQPRVYVGLGG